MPEPLTLEMDDPEGSLRETYEEGTAGRRCCAGR